MPEPTQHKNLKFTAIIPVYNGVTTLARAIDSVLAQSYPAHQIIIVDDASTDNTAAFVQGRYADKVTFIQKLTNQGSSATRNKGMDAATGDYIAFLDADDAWHKDKLMLLNSIFSSKPDITLFYHPFTQDNIMDKKLPEDIVVYKFPLIKLLPANVIATSCMIVRNDPAFRFEATMRYMEDFDLALRIGYKYKIYMVNIPLTQIFRPFTSEGGISANKWKMRKGELRAYTRLLKLNPLFIGLLPFLWASSLGKHFIKMFRK